MPENHKRRNLESGDKIGKYQLEEIIHQGKHRTIFKAYDPFLDRNVAIKLSTYADCKHTEEDSQQLRNSFFLETRAIGKLQHPNIVSVFDAGVGDRQTYIVMEYIDAKSLASILKSHEEMPIQKAIGIIFKCCKALEYSHQHNVIHRDIKPDNILITKDGDVKIVDFGVAKVRGQIDTMTTGIFGSPSYMAPEQIEESNVVPATDIYALGVVFYELLTRERLFQADNVHTLMFKILNEEPKTLFEMNISHADKLQPILSEALKKDPEKRYPSATDLAVALQSIDAELRDQHIKVEKECNEKLVSQLDFFHEFSSRDISEFTDVASWIKITEGQTIVSAGEIDNTFYVILKGEAVVFKNNDPVKTLNSGDCFGELGLLHNHHRNTSIMASGDSMLLKLSQSDLANLSGKVQAQFYKALANSLVKRLSKSKQLADKAA